MGENTETGTIRDMDQRIIKRIERTSGLPFADFPKQGVAITVSPARNDKPKNRLLVERVMENEGVLITGIPRIVDAISERVRSMSPWEIFTPFGIEEVKRFLPPDDAASLDETWGLEYILRSHGDFHPVRDSHPVSVLRERDIPPEDYELRISERRSTEADDFIWAYACYHDLPGIPQVRLPEYGPRCACVSAVIWEDDAIAGFGVGTEEALQGKGYATAVISAATEWVLTQEALPVYGASSNNTASIRIARRLGYTYFRSSFGA